MKFGTIQIPVWILIIVIQLQFIFFWRDYLSDSLLKITSLRSMNEIDEPTTTTNLDTEMIEPIMTTSLSAIVYLVSDNQGNRRNELEISLLQLCNNIQEYISTFELVLICFKWEEPTTITIPEACSSGFRKIVRAVIDPFENQYVKDLFHNNGQNVEERDYKLMIWFWLHGVITVPVLRPYRYIMRFDSDSILLSNFTTNPIITLQESNAMIGYHCFAYEYHLFTNGLWDFINKHYTATNYTPMDPNFQYATNSSNRFPMLYTNFLVFDREALALRNDILQFSELAIAGTIQYRWGDAPLWAAIVGLFLNPNEIIHINDFAYQHGRNNRFITLNDNDEVIEWDYDIYMNKTNGRDAVGHCYDMRIKDSCIWSDQGGIQNPECPQPMFILS